MTADKHALRIAMKRRRRALDRHTIATASALIAAQLRHSRPLKRARRIAIYMSARGEIDCEPILHAAWLRKMRVFAPVLAGQSLKFAPLCRHTQMRPNRYGLLEPVYSPRACIAPRNIDIVFVPLVAFDEHCNRLGMGGGYYDRTFAFLRHRKNLRRPLLIGLAYDFQRVANLQPAAWDVPLHAVVTEKESYGSH